MVILSLVIIVSYTSIKENLTGFVPVTFKNLNSFKSTNLKWK